MSMITRQLHVAIHDRIDINSNADYPTPYCQASRHSVFYYAGATVPPSDIRVW